MAAIFDRVSDLYDYIIGRGGPSTDGSPHTQLFIETSASSSAGVGVDIESILREPTAMSCVNIITQGISQLPMQVKKYDDAGGCEVMKDHPVSVLMKRPNNFQSATEFKGSIVTSLLTQGNAFIRIIRAGPDADALDGMNINGRVSQLVVMDADEMAISSDGLGFPLFTQDKHNQIANENMIHIRDFTVFTAQGQSRPKLGAEIIGAKIAADRLMGRTFKNGLNMKYAVTSNAPYDPAEVAAMQTALQQTFGPAGAQSGGAIVISNGDVKPIKGLTPADTDLRELRDQLKDEIAGLFRVPPSMVGGKSDEKFNNVRQKLASFHRDTLNPIITGIEEAMTLKLLDDPTEQLMFDVSELLKGDIETETKLAVEAAGGPIISINEARRKVGYNPLKDEDMDSIRASGPEPEPQPTGGETGPRSNDNREDSPNE